MGCDVSLGDRERMWDFMVVQGNGGKGEGRLVV